jgi:carbonic anhydrase
MPSPHDPPVLHACGFGGCSGYAVAVTGDRKYTKLPSAAWEIVGGSGAIHFGQEVKIRNVGSKELYLTMCGVSNCSGGFQISASEETSTNKDLQRWVVTDGNKVSQQQGNRYLKEGSMIRLKSVKFGASPYGPTHLDVCGKSQCGGGYGFGVATTSRPERLGGVTTVWTVQRVIPDDVVRSGDLVKLSNGFGQKTLLMACGDKTSTTRNLAALKSDAVLWQVVRKTAHKTGLPMEPLKFGAEIVLNTVKGSPLSASRATQGMCGAGHGVVTTLDGAPFLFNTQERSRWRIEGGTGYVTYNSEVRLRLASSKMAVLTICGNTTSPGKKMQAWKTYCAASAFEVGVANTSSSMRMPTTAWQFIRSQLANTTSAPSKASKASANSAETAKVRSKNWGYGKRNGPGTWATIYTPCAGRRQSPINIKKRNVIKRKGAGELLISYSKAPAGSLKMENNGHTVKVFGNGLIGDYILLLGRRYKLQQFHFHSLSEHRVNGEQFPMEAQFVHKDDAGHYLILAVLFRIGAENSALNQLGFSLIPRKGSRMRTGQVSPMGILPTKWHEFYAYEGSFTSPPCTEGIKWLVQQQYQTLSWQTFQAFPFKNNFRPPQPLNGRVVTMTFRHMKTSLYKHWGYNAKDGPATWSQVYPRCAGKQQSPIDIKKKVVVAGESRKDLNIHFATAPANALTAENTGHTIKVFGNGLIGSFTQLGGYKYHLQQFHFHSLSEHRVDGEQFPMEAQFVHQDEFGRFMIISVLFRSGKENKPVASLGFAALKRNGTKALEGAIDPMQIIPKDWKQFYFYWGSFTTPPCTEGVKWVVLQQFQTASWATLSLFPYQSNFRPPQPLNGRVVVKDVATWSAREPLPKGTRTRSHAWGYGKRDGPLTWPKKFTACAGKQQSPVDINTKKVVKGESRGELGIVFRKAAAGSLQVENTGRTIKVFGNGLIGDYTVLNGRKYKLQQFHFHSLSEHRVNGEQFPMEAQFVHKDGDGTHLVVSVLFRTGPENAALSKIGFRQSVQVGRKLHEASLNPAQLLPNDLYSFYFYTGSLTTPPCTEGVKWVVLRNQQTASWSTIASFPYKNNFRPPEPLNGRVVAMTSTQRILDSSHNLKSFTDRKSPKSNTDAPITLGSLFLSMAGSIETFNPTVVASIRLQIAILLHISQRMVRVRLEAGSVVLRVTLPPKPLLMLENQIRAGTVRLLAGRTIESVYSSNGAIHKPARVQPYVVNQVQSTLQRIIYTAVPTNPLQRERVIVYATHSPTTGVPTTSTKAPSQAVTQPTKAPLSRAPTHTHKSTAEPTSNPSTHAPTTKAPTLTPTEVPTLAPTNTPSLVPTVNPTFTPTVMPTPNPSSADPTYMPSVGPTTKPTSVPTPLPSTLGPTVKPTLFPTYDPTPKPASKATPHKDKKARPLRKK